MTMLTRDTKSLVLLTISCGALVLAGCATMLDAITGSIAIPVMQLSSVQHVPNLFTGARHVLAAR